MNAPGQEESATITKSEPAAHISPSGIRVLDTPVDPAERAEYVREMFDQIAPRYDLLNSLLSLNIHRFWRKFAARCAALSPGDSAVDVCAGTGDFSVELAKRVGPAGRVAALDFSQAMLDAGAAKYDRYGIEAVCGDATAMPYSDCQFHAAVIGFGIRNIGDPQAAVREMARVARPGGRVVVLEFSQPVNRVFKLAYDFHSRWIMPGLGKWVSGRSEPYTYLPESVKRWKTREQMSSLLDDAGLVRVRSVDLTFGVVCVHVGEKPLE